MLISAPYTGPKVQITLPNVSIGDQRRLVGKVNNKLAMDGTRYTYIKTNNDRLLRLTWDMLSRTKIEEVIEFIEFACDKEIRIIDYESATWKVILLTNPAALEMDRRGSPSSQIEEVGSVTLEFIGVEI